MSSESPMCFPHTYVKRWNNIDQSYAEKRKANDEPTNPETPRNKDLKYDREKRTRIFQNSWIDKFPWVVFDENAQEMYCKYCRKFPHLSDRKDALTQGTKKLRNDGLKLHDKHQEHLLCVKHWFKEHDPQAAGGHSQAFADTLIGQSLLKLDESQRKRLENVKYTLLIGHTYLIGRKNCDVLLSGDAALAVSRKHAQIELVHPETNITNTDKLPTVTLTDLSKFGTSVNGEKIKNTELHDGDMIVFGIHSNFTLVYEPFIISSSCLDRQSKTKIRQLICVLGGHIVNDWKRECSLLVMNNISVTIKVVCALLSLKHIVTPDYLEKYVNYLKGENEKPDPDIYLPIVTETQLDSSDVSFKVVKERKNIFQGMKFIFLNDKQFKKMHIAVELGGGLPVLLEEKWKNDRMLVEKGSVVMHCEPSQCTQVLSQDSNNWVLHVQSYLRKHKKHMIQDAELGFAVLYCSTETHCNPDGNTGSQILAHVPSQSVSHTDILVANTEVSSDRSPTRIRKKKCETVLEETKFENQGKTQVDHSVVDNEVTQERRKKFPTKLTITTEDSQSTSKQASKRVPFEEEEEIIDIIPLKKKVKQEVCTPSRLENESRNRRASPRRSPSPATRSSPSKKTSSPPMQQKSKEKVKVKKEIVEDSDDELENKRNQCHVIVDDSDDDFPDFNFKSKSKKIVFPKKTTVNSDSEDEITAFPSKRRNEMETTASQHKKITNKDSNDDLPSNRSSQRKNIKKETLSTPRSRSKRMSDDDSDDEIQSDKQESSRKPDKHKFIVEDSDEDGDTCNRLKRKKKIVTDSSDDEFDRLTSKRRKTVAASEDDNTVSDDNSKNRTRNSPTKQSTGQFNERTVKIEAGDTEPTEGFVSTQKPGQDGDSRTTDHVTVKEEDLPSKCINIKFVDLVARRPSKTKKTSTDGIPDGYVRWKGKIVRNYKAFKKTEHAGANSLPRIIGGSDLVAHNAANRKDLDDWFKEIIHDESQQNETEKEAKKLFDWEPGMKKRSR